MDESINGNGKGLHYKNYDSWIEKVSCQVMKGEKEAIITTSNGEVIGDIIHQPYQNTELGRIREIKNLRIRGRDQGWGIGRFLINLVEKSSEGDYDGLVLDVRANQEATYNFLRTMGFEEFIPKINLYDSQRKDIVMFKAIGKKSCIWLPKVKKIITAKSYEYKQQLKESTN